MPETLPVEQILDNIKFVVVLHEGSFRGFLGGFQYEYEAKKFAERHVDDATRNRNWVYQRYQNEFRPIGYAYFGGDGETYYQEAAHAQR